MTELNEALQSTKDNVEITPFPKKVRDLHKTMKIHYKDGESDVFELDYHGMGTRSWASLLAFKSFVSWENSGKNTQPKEPYFPLLALEEPESHLHPNAQRQLNKQKGLTLATVHTAKGLGFDVVFLMGMNEGTFPDYRAKKDKLEEEKNTAYVAVTRAKRWLYITYPNFKMMPWGDLRKQSPSRFIPKFL